MIIGIGFDLIEVARIARQVDGDSRFKEKMFTSAEIEYCESCGVNKAQHYAARFAAKEAFFKAIGSGYRGGLAFNEIAIVNDELGKPLLHLSGKTEEFAQQRQVAEIHVSLSHLRELAGAVVIIESK